MALRVLRCFEYQLECDVCGDWETLHTGDGLRSGEYVHDIESARRCCNYHTSKGLVFCDNCFKKRKAVRKNDTNE